MTWPGRGAAALLLLSAPAWGQAPGAPPPDQAEVQALREAVEALKEQNADLERRLDGIWNRYDTDQQEAAKKSADTAKTTPKVSLNGDGLRITSGDGAFESRIGLRLLHDFAWFNQDEKLKRYVFNEQDGTGFRAARVTLRGKAWNDITYNAEIDFAGQNGADAPKFRDVWVQYNGIPYGGERAFDVRVGHFKEPFSLDELNAVTDRVFQENPLLDVFVPTRNVGVQLSDALIGEPKKERLTWTIGAFKETDDLPSSNDSDEDQGYQITGRVTGLPYYADDGKKLLHLGLAYSLRNPDGAPLAYGARPETRLSNFRWANPDSALLPQGFRLQNAIADDVNLLGLEAAGIFGPFSFQSEYVRADVDTVFGGDLTYDGWYAQAAYVITGESHTYRHDSARFSRPTPERPFANRGDKRGPGAWEIAARYGAVDLSDGPVEGGEHTALTLGLNWYLNQNFLWSLNYIRNDIDNPLYDGDFDVLQTRFQLEF